MQARVSALSLVLLVGCTSAKMPAPVKSTIASIQVRCAGAGNSGLRMWKCETPPERAEFAALIVGQYGQATPPEHFIILRQHDLVWVDVIERKTHLRGTIRFADERIVEAGNDIAARTMPLVRNGKTVAYATWCMDGEWDVYQAPRPSRDAAMEACRAYWKRTPHSGTGSNSVAF